MWQFSQVVDGVSEACRALETPITGGNVSFYNETLGQSIYPTPVIGILGLLEDASRAVGMGFHAAGDVIVLLNGGKDAEEADRVEEFSSSEYAKTIQGVTCGAPPDVDLAAEKRLIECLVALAEASLIHSAHDVSDGGLAVTLAESCFASNNLSAEIALDSAAPAEFALFGERGARAIISCAPEDLARVLESARKWKVTTREIGKVGGTEFRIHLNGKPAIQAGVSSLRDAWTMALESALKGAA
jgi:phosphoribosylformylglycinamidine synthase